MNTPNLEDLADTLIAECEREIAACPETQEGLMRSIELHMVMTDLVRWSCLKSWARSQYKAPTSTDGD